MSKRHSEQFKQVAVAYVPSNKDKPVKAIALVLDSIADISDLQARIAQVDGRFDE